MNDEEEPAPSAPVSDNDDHDDVASDSEQASITQKRMYIHRHVHTNSNVYTYIYVDQYIYTFSYTLCLLSYTCIHTYIHTLKHEQSPGGGGKRIGYSLNNFLIFLCQTMMIMMTWLLIQSKLP